MWRYRHVEGHDVFQYPLLWLFQYSVSPAARKHLEELLKGSVFFFAFLTFFFHLINFLIFFCKSLLGMENIFYWNSPLLGYSCDHTQDIEHQCPVTSEELICQKFLIS